MKGLTFVGQKPDAVLYEEQAPALLAYFYRQTASRDDAEDLLVEVFLAALEDERFRGLPKQEQKLWLWGVARNKTADHFRRSKRQASLPLDTEVVDAVIEDPGLTPEKSLVQQETYAELHAALNSLPREQQELLELRFGHELSFGQIALVQEKTAGAVRMRLLRALKQLRAIYKKSAR